MSRRSGSNGFTLIELMITVAVVAILSAVALPSYQAYVRKSARSAAQSFMMAVAGRQEQIMLDQRTYVAVTANANFPLAPSSGGVNIAVPSDTTGRYTFGVILTTAVTCPAPALYCVIATAVGNQASDGNLGLDSLATKTPADKWQ